jgi:hypothetical protein
VDVEAYLLRESWSSSIALPASLLGCFGHLACERTVYGAISAWKPFSVGYVMRSSRFIEIAATYLKPLQDNGIYESTEEALNIDIHTDQE